MKQAWKNETSSTPVFLRPPPYRARAIPSRGPLRFRRIAVPAGGNEWKLGSKHRIQATTNGAQDSSNPYYPHPASRCGEHNANQPSPLRAVRESPSPCESSRFARCFSPSSCSPQRLAGVGEYKSDEAHAALVAARLLRADQRRLRFLPLGVASHDARPRGSETVRARCGVDARGIDGKGMLFAASLFSSALLGAQTQRSWISAGMGWAGALPLHPRSGRCPENLQGGLSPLTPFCLRRGGYAQGLCPCIPAGRCPDPPEELSSSGLFLLPAALLVVVFYLSRRILWRLSGLSRQAPLPSSRRRRPVQSPQTRHTGARCPQ